MEQIILGFNITSGAILAVALAFVAYRVAGLIVDKFWPGY